MTDDFVESVKIESIDELFDTQITVSCYRETGRLDRMLKVFQRCLTIINDQVETTIAFNGAIVKLHDHKGTLTVTWRSLADFSNYRAVVEQAWTEFGEVSIEHQDLDSRELRVSLGNGDVAGFELIGAPAMCVLRDLTRRFTGQR